MKRTARRSMVRPPRVRSRSGVAAVVVVVVLLLASCGASTDSGRVDVKSGSQHGTTSTASNPSTTTTDAGAADLSTPPPSSGDAPWSWSAETIEIDGLETTSWASEAVEDIACMADGRCVAVGATAAAGTAPTGRILASDDRGATWSLVHTTAEDGFLHGVSCVDESCLVVGEACPEGSCAGGGARPLVLRSSDRGTTWATIDAGDLQGPAQSAACTTGMCLVTIGQAGVSALYELSNTGTWSLVDDARVSTTAMTGAAVECDPQGPCWILAFFYDSMNDGGSVLLARASDGTWRVVELPEPLRRARAMSCGAFGCAVLSPADGQVAFSRSDDLETWTEPTPIARYDHGRLDLECVSSARCVAAVGSRPSARSVTVYESIDGGGQWATVLDLPRKRISALVCALESGCLGVGSGHDQPGSTAIVVRGLVP